MKKNKAAVALGRKGGKARAAKLSPERRKEIATKGGYSRWPEKRHTFDCKVAGCKVTIPHEHISN